jgi:hypothetical protein
MDKNTETTAPKLASIPQTDPASIPRDGGTGDRGLDICAACGRRSGRLEIIRDPASLIRDSRRHAWLSSPAAPSVITSWSKVLLK